MGTKEGGCSKQKSPGMFVIGMKKAGGKVECMYFPDMAARLYSNPRRTPKVLTQRMRMLDVVGEGKSRFVGWQTNNNLCGLGVAPGKSVDDALLEQGGCLQAHPPRRGRRFGARHLS